MATDGEHMLSDEEEPKIPVFTVLKNGAILKNIFIVSNSDHCHLNPMPADREQILIVGRHPDCNIMLTHPSVSRFHLKILSNPSLHKLSVIDLSSVHGTWVLEKKIEPWVRVELREGDSMRIGGSSRVYRLHWIPLSQAYDFKCPHLSASNPLLTEEKEEEVPIEAYQDENSFPTGNKPAEEEENMVKMEMKTQEEECEVIPEEKEEDVPIEAFQDENSLPIGNKPAEEEENMVKMEMKTQEEEECEGNNYLFMENKEIQSLDLVVEGMSFLFAEESLGKLMKKEILSAPPMPEHLMYSIFDDDDERIESSLPFECAESGKDNQVPEPFTVTESICERECRESSSAGPDREFVCKEKPDLAALAFEETENQMFIEYFGQTNKSTLLVGATENQNDDMKDLDLEKDKHLESSSGRPEREFICEENSDLVAVALEAAENQSLFRDDFGQANESTLLAGEVVCRTENQHDDMKELDPEAVYALELPSRKEKQENFKTSYDEVIPASERIEETEELKLSHEHLEHREYYTLCMTESTNSSFPAEGLVSEISEDKENLTPQSFYTVQSETIGNSPIRPEKTPGFGSIWLRRGKPANIIQLRTGRTRGETKVEGLNPEYEQHNHENMEDKPIPKEAFSCLNCEEEEIFTPDKENFTPNTLQVQSLKEKGKLASVSQLQTSKSRVKSKLVGTDSDGENYNRERTEYKSTSREIFSCLDGKEEEVFTPNKENLTPNTLLFKSLKKVKVEKVKHSRGCGPSSPGLNFSPNMNSGNDLMASSNKENGTLRVLRELKPVKQTISGNQVLPERELMVNKRAQERVPFQSLVVNSVGKARSDTLGPTSATKSVSAANYAQTVEKKITYPLPNNFIREVKRSWTMVVDTTTLLNKESRKTLQLLQGLRGTRLIIPRMVIRELDCLKRRGSLFRRKTKACLVLEWIEQCMVENSWWIQVQSSAEDGRLTAPTPPASPQSLFSQGSGGFFCGTSSLPLLSHGSLMDIISPSTEDHVLECSLLCRNRMSYGHLVLLSDDISLKIRAMAEGLVCETAQDFRESLMNPFSERFLWVESSPRGQTWSVSDDVFLREKYDRFPLKKSLKGESAKGLKLILLHNSQYGQRTLIC